jgi:two-component system nitrogen regulation response regulator NtrX
MPTRTRILIVDDAANIRQSLSEILSDEGYEPLTAGTGDGVPASVQGEAVELVLLDVMLPGQSGVDVLRRVKEQTPDVEVVMVSGHATIDLAVEAIRAGAYDFLEKPLSRKRVLLTVERALERRALRGDRRQRDAAEDERFRMVGESAAMKRVWQEIEQAAPTSARVLVTGETGTGKELAAYWLHRRSQRGNGPFVRINCAAIPRDLLESELFGYEKGAFTGALTRKPGKFESAHTGTVFLDEIGDMDPMLQAKLLRVLENGEFEALGSNRPTRVDIRVVAATNKNLGEEIRRSRFREDLYHRLNVIAIHVPPLRERPDDVPVLAEHFLSACCRENGMSARRFTAEALDYLRGLPFPGNIRELKNLVERAVIVSRGDTVEKRALVHGSDGAGGADALFLRTRPLAQARDELERMFLERQMALFAWNITRAAEELQVERSNLSRRLKQLGLHRPGAGEAE